MEEIKFDYSEVPFQYLHCSNSLCPRAQECLRHRAYQQAPDDITSLFMVNPRYAEAHPDDCRHYRPIRTKTLARGFEKILGPMTHDQFRAFRAEAHTHFGHAAYYRYLNGVSPLSPDKQDYIRQLVHQLGIQADPTTLFDHYEERIDW